jgi:hypothetical protein
MPWNGRDETRKKCGVKVFGSAVDGTGRWLMTYYSSGDGRHYSTKTVLAVAHD